mmetsp:Transcript_22529/g.49786  ORF Transcript_22529/g.49786 Transcript_22529/m.49786 type:complete len:260 (-) Transcript_22529:762-1541(-)
MHVPGRSCKRKGWSSRKASSTVAWFRLRLRSTAGVAEAILSAGTEAAGSAAPGAKAERSSRPASNGSAEFAAVGRLGLFCQASISSEKSAAQIKRKILEGNTVQPDDEYRRLAARRLNRLAPYRRSARNLSEMSTSNSNASVDCSGGRSITETLFSRSFALTRVLVHAKASGEVSVATTDPAPSTAQRQLKVPPPQPTSRTVRSLSSAGFVAAMRRKASPKDGSRATARRRSHSKELVTTAGTGPPPATVAVASCGKAT